MKYFLLLLGFLLGCSRGGMPFDAGVPDANPDASAAMCTRCDAVLNPCPALGLDCNPATGCCAARVRAKVGP